MGVIKAKPIVPRGIRGEGGMFLPQSPLSRGGSEGGKVKSGKVGKCKVGIRIEGEEAWAP